MVLGIDDAVLGGVLSAGAKGIGGLIGKLEGDALATDMKRKARLADTFNLERVKEYNAALEDRIADATAYAKEMGEKGETTTQNSRYDHQTYSQTDANVGAMMAAAEKYGFNPLSFLRNGGLAAFTVTSQREWGWDSAQTNTTNRQGAAQLVMQGALADRQLFQRQSEYVSGGNIAGVQQSSFIGPVIGEALSSGVDQYFNLKQQNFQNDMSEKYLAATLNGLNKQAQSGSGSISRSFYVPSATQAGSVSSGKLGSGGNPMPLYITTVDNNPNSPTYGKKQLIANPDLPDSEQVLMPALARLDDVADKAAKAFVDGVYGASKWFDPWTKDPKGVRYDPVTGKYVPYY